MQSRTVTCWPRLVNRWKLAFSPVVLVMLLSVGSVGRSQAEVDADSANADWPQLLGPHRNGISAETDLIDVWPKDGPAEVWRVPGGVGMSALVTKGDRLLTLIQREGKQRLVALNRLTGKTEWEVAVAPEFLNSMGDGPRAAPTIAEDRVFTFSGQGILACVNFQDGKLLWSHDLVTELKGEVAAYGMACSPLVVGDLVVVTVGAPQATVVALDVKSGKLAWKAGEDVAGYSSPALLHVGGRDQIVVATGGSILGLAPSKGDILWRYPFETNYECNIATPLAIDDQVFISSGENHGSALLALTPARDKFTVNEVWSSFGPKSTLRNEWQTSLLLDGFLYGMDNVGGAGPITHLTCIAADTGKRAWQQSRFGKGNMIAADGKLFISTMEGELVVVRATPGKYEELGRKVVIGTTRQAPTLSHGMLYLRDDAEILCLDVRTTP